MLYVSFLSISNNIFIYDKLIQWFITKGVVDYTGFFAYIILGWSLSIAIVILLSHKYTTKIFSYIILLSSSLATYMITKYNVAIDKSMILNIIHTNTTESLTLFSVNMIPYILFLAIIPMVVIYKINIVYERPIKHIFTSTLYFLLFILLSFVVIYLKFNSLHLAGNRSKKYLAYQLVPINFLGASGSNLKHYIKENYISKPEPKKIVAKLTKKEDVVVVLAIGESARQLNFNLYGYDRVITNPLLSKIDGIYPLNGIAKYGSTIWALPRILSRDDIKLPSISDFVGIDSTCFVNYQVYGNCGTVKEEQVNNCGHNGNCYDEDVIPMLKKDLSTYRDGQKFVLLHIGAGSHGPLYNTRYPEEFQQFNPQCLSADVMNDCTKEELYNSYDNTILYTDYVVSNIIKTLDNSKVPYVFIYISDHGESLLEEDRVFHGMPPGIDLPSEQAHIPLIVKASIPIDIIKVKEYKQQDLYDTILDILSIDIDLLNKDKVFIKLK
jgi:lipid A ethanolaminephosphotransferase